MSGKLTSVRLLLVEDNEPDADLIRRSLLRANATLARFDLDTVDRASAAAARLAEEAYDAVLLDLTLPDGRGLDSLATVQKVAGETPIIVVTGYDDESLAVEAVHRGAQDYLLKADLGGRSMARSIVYAIERRRSLDSIRRSEARLAEAQAIAQLGSFEWNLATDRVDGSIELQRIYGLTGGEPGVSSLVDFADFIEHIHAEDRPRAEDALRACRGTGTPLVLEYRIVRPDGELRSLLARGVVAVDDDGRPLRLTATCQDLTERKQLEAQVLLAGRMAAVGTLSGGVAHEINNPLAYLMSNLDFAHHEVASFLARQRARGEDEGAGRAPLAGLADVEEALDEARHGAERVRNIVRDLKTFSRTDDGKARGPVPVHPMLESSINLAWNEIRHRAQLHRAFDDVPAVLGNQARLGQVFVNLLVNAAQSIPEGQAERNTITVLTRRAGPGQVCIEVRDTGCGIPTEHVTRVFDPFFTTKQVGAAMGLGLSICYGVVHALGGEIQVESLIGKGSLFRVLLPAAPARDDAEVVDEHERPGARRGRVLVIDDEPMVIATLRRVLGRQHDVVTATSGRAALEQLQAGERFDAVLCDLMMPDLTGMALHDELERAWPEQAARMIFITGGAFTPRGVEFLERVSNPRLEKPFDVGRLLALVRTLVT